MEELFRTPNTFTALMELASIHLRPDDFTVVKDKKIETLIIDDTVKAERFINQCRSLGLEIKYTITNGNHFIGISEGSAL